MTTALTPRPAAPLAQLRPAHPDVWEAVYAAAPMIAKQALSAALLGHPALARQIIEAGPGAWMVMDWPDLTPKAKPEPAPAPDLPRDEDGRVNTSAEFGESFLVQVEYVTDFDGRQIDPAKEEYPRTLHGPFKTRAEADAWIEDYPEADDVEDWTVIVLNNVRPEPEPAPAPTTPGATDERVVDCIATMLGTSHEWNGGDVCESVANLIGTVRPHPGDKGPDVFAAEFRAATGRDVIPAWDNRD